MEEERSRALREVRIVWQLHLARVAVDVDFRRLFETEDEEAGIVVVDVDVVVGEQRAIREETFAFMSLSHLLLVGLGNLPLPATRHRLVSVQQEGASHVFFQRRSLDHRLAR